jgi:hypothetical protein
MPVQIPSSWISAIQNGARAGGSPVKPVGYALKAIEDTLLLIAAAAGSPSGGGGIAGTIFVNPAGDPLTAQRGTFNAFPTIQGALNAAQAGDTIFISKANYTENVSIPRVDDLALIALSDGVVITGATNADTISIANGPPVVLTSLVLRGITFVGTSGGNAVNLGDPSLTLFASTSRGVQFVDCVSGISQFVNLGHLTVEESEITFLLTTGIDKFDCTGNKVTVHSDEYHDNASPTGSTDYRLRTYRNNKFFRQSNGVAVTFSGAQVVDMDGTNQILGNVVANLSPNAGLGIDPLLILGASIRPYNTTFQPINQPLLTINFADVPFSQSSSRQYPSGFDLSGISCYGSAFIIFNHVLGAPLDASVNQFQAIGGSFEGGMIVTAPVTVGPRYIVKVRSVNFGYAGKKNTDIISKLMAFDGVDIDARGCDLSNCFLDYSGTGAIDRSVISTANLTLGNAGTGSVGITPPLPSYVTGFLGDNTYNLFSKVSDQTIGVIAFANTSNNTRFDYVYTPPGFGPYTASFTIIRDQNVPLFSGPPDTPNRPITSWPMYEDSSVFDLSHDLGLDSPEALHLAAFVEDKTERAHRDGFVSGVVSTILVASAITALGLAVHRLLVPPPTHPHFPHLPPGYGGPGAPDGTGQGG